MTVAPELPTSNGIAPLFGSEIHDGPTDPVLVFHSAEQAWWLVYTRRRPSEDLDDSVAWVHGTDLGAASSTDGGATWVDRGRLEGLDLIPGRDTFWAPELIAVDGTYHLFVSWIAGVPVQWRGHPRSIRHYTSDDLHDWTFVSTLELSSDRVIDAAVHARPDGGWRLWYKDEAHGSHTWAADSDDLTSWRVVGAVLEHAPHEGPNVFALGGRYWMVVDEWVGLAIYVSHDLTTWSRQGRILDGSGQRAGDAGIGHHADVVVDGESAVIVYFTHPDRASADRYEQRRSRLQVARLRVLNDRLVVDRDEPMIAPIVPLTGFFIDSSKHKSSTATLGNPDLHSTSVSIQHMVSPT